jgi:hypothetical protein
MRQRWLDRFDRAELAENAESTLALDLDDDRGRDVAAPAFVVVANLSGSASAGTRELVLDLVLRVRSRIGVAVRDLPLAVLAPVDLGRTEDVSPRLAVAGRGQPALVELRPPRAVRAVAPSLPQVRRPLWLGSGQDGDSKDDPIPDQK